jgi:hypothetical protein
MATKKGTNAKKPAKKAAAKKSAAKKPAKKVAPKKPAKKAAPKKSAKKAAAKKSAAKKAAPKKAAAKKPAKKVAPKKSAKKASSKKSVRKAAAKDRAASAARAVGKADRKKRKGAPKKGEVKQYRPKARMGPDGVLILSGDKVLYQAYYGENQIPSPTGGFLMRLGVQPEEGGGAVALFECSASSVRCRLAIPKATRTERSKVRAVQEAGDDPDCPRHGPGHRLVRKGKELTCRLCGVSYGKV